MFWTLLVWKIILIYIYNFIREFNSHNKYSKNKRLLERGEFLLGPSGTYEIRKSS